MKVNENIEVFIAGIKGDKKIEKVANIENEADCLTGLIELQTTCMFYLWEDGNLQRLKLSALPLPSLESKLAAKTKLELDVIGFNYFSFTPD